VPSFAMVTTSSSGGKSRTSSLAQNEPGGVGRYGSDDLLLLATDLVRYSRRPDPIEPFRIQNANDHVEGTQGHSLIDESLAITFEIWK
jgi:hypothetical protein